MTPSHRCGLPTIDLIKGIWRGGCCDAVLDLARPSDDGRERNGKWMSTMAPGVVISEVARRHDLRPQQLFAWRHQARAAASHPPRTQQARPR
jgi:hypothetical protein